MARRLIVALLLLAACGGAAEPPITASVARDRLFDVTGTFELTFVNDGDDAVEVTAVELRSALFEPVGGDERQTTVDPGRPTSMPLRYGEPRCVGEPSDALRVAATVDGDDVVLDAGGASSGMLRLHAEQCAAAAVREAVDVSFAGDWRALEPTRATGTIVLDPVGDAEVTLESVSTQIVFVTAAATPATGNVEVVVTAARCDAHALTESKKTFLFTLVLSIDGGEPVRLEQRATEGPVLDAMKRAIDECVAARTAH
jgi:hypothetical protein